MPDAVPQFLSATELAWLRVQGPVSPAVSTVLLNFPRKLDFRCLKSRIEDRLMALERFRQRVESPRLPLARPRWREDDKFALSHHLFREELDLHERPEALEELVGRLFGQPLDVSRPLWQIHVLDGVGEGSALVARVHHSIADPTAVPRLVLSLTDLDSGAAEGWTEALPEGDHPLGLERLISRSKVLDAAREGGAHTRMLCRLIASRADRDHPLRSRRTTEKSVAWSPDRPLADLQSCATRHRATPEEIVLTAVATALRDELHRRDTPVEDIDLRAVVPLSLRAPGESPAGTRMALALVAMPLRPLSPTERLEQARRELHRLAHSTDNVTVLGLKPGRGFSMSEIEERSLRLMGQKASMMLSLLAGPHSPVCLCGEPLGALMWWPGLSEDLGLAISAVSCSGQVRFGVALDDSDRDAARRLARGISDSLERML